MENERLDTNARVPIAIRRLRQLLAKFSAEGSAHASPYETSPVFCRIIHDRHRRSCANGKSGFGSTAVNQNLAAIAVGAGISRTVFLHGPTARAGASFTHRGPARFDIFEKDGLRKI